MMFIADNKFYDNYNWFIIVSQLQSYPMCINGIKPERKSICVYTPEVFDYR